MRSENAWRVTVHPQIGGTARSATRQRRNSSATNRPLRADAMRAKNRMRRVGRSPPRFPYASPGVLRLPHAMTAPREARYIRGLKDPDGGVAQTCGFRRRRNASRIMGETFMASNVDRRFANLLFWLVLLMGAVALACGWAALHAPLGWRSDLHDLHIALGLAGAILIVVQLVRAIVSLAAGGTLKPRGARAAVYFMLRQAAYLSFLALVATGAGHVVFGGEPISFFGVALPSLNVADADTSEALRDAHFWAAYIFTGAILACLAAAGIGALFPPRAPSPPAPTPPPLSIQAMIAEGLVQSFRFFGRTAFWTQSIIALVSLPLLAFSFVGHSVSPSHTVLGDTIYWALGGIALLFASIFVGSFYRRAARAIQAEPRLYLGVETRRLVWLLMVNGFISVFGALVSFVGVGLSVALLIGKIVSQPPGIAITDPQKIIRALDVFVLLVNFNLLFAHFIGVAIVAWLTINSLRARHQYAISLNSSPPGGGLENGKSGEARS
jgi:cytochrome b561